jgi:hypothetical protein
MSLPSRLCRRCPRFLLSVLILFLSWVKQPPCLADEAWRTVALPERPLDIAAQADALWVCGAGEMIARSIDGGKTWEMKHRQSRGDVLMRIVFVDESVAFAGGTNGALLATRDGGANWDRVKSDEATILDLSFSDAGHGIRRTRSGVATTADGGLHWNAVSFLKTDPVARDYDNILTVASLDPQHLAIALHKTHGENIFVFTADGGATWKSLHLDNTFAGLLFTHTHEYWAFGVEYLEREKSGGYSAPVALHSADGEEWAHGVRPPSSFNSCTEQGCVMHAGAIVQLYDAQPSFIAVPPDGYPRPRWAFAVATVCTVDVDLRCAPASVQATPPARPEATGWRPAGIAIPLAFESKPLSSDCLRCELGAFPASKDLRGMTEITLRLTIEKDGTVREVQTTPRAIPQIQKGVESIAENWLFEPARSSSGPVQSQQVLKLALFCSPIPDSDSGACRLSSPLPKRY